MIEKVDLTNIPELIAGNKKTATNIRTSFGVSDEFWDKMIDGLRNNFERIVLEPDDLTKTFAEAINFAKEISTTEAEAACTVFQVMEVVFMMNADARAGRIPGMSK